MLYQILHIILGLGLFLFGIEYMSQGIQAFSQKRVKQIIENYVSSPIKGIVIGTLTTAVIQSSSAITSLVITLIKANTMTLNQAVGIIVGANIGTTMTAFIVSLQIENLSIYFMIIGSFLIFISKYQKISLIGQICFGFGCLFYGLEIMNLYLAPLAHTSFFHEIILILSKNPIYALTGGIFLTCIIQSSSVMIAIIQQLGQLKMISLVNAIAFLLGSNIGTTITATLAALGDCKEAKQAAFFHFIFNAGGVLIFALFLYPFSLWMSQIKMHYHLSYSMTIALSHFFFNIISTIVIIPFINKISYWIEKLK
ncbi:Na/Pi cotransporter family protein [Coprobacillus sp. AF33-1AC]|uniref:Na/Pi cotransporter family protein n=1 Tax=Coprobacillus sp. AF33-1AC TaxID=2292032 RepID=UPI000E466A3A|nr:Na/Pi symporter [Coprobacillus sp. AF33-1AC]RHM62608.1 Na/Pi cotransporter family protein [Coprobacillus sp. AF33-1AC]